MRRVLCCEVNFTCVDHTQAILIPWNSPGHWSLLCIDSSSKKLKCIDSLNSTVVPNAVLARRLCSFIGIDNNIRRVQSVQQRDTDSCGVFVVLNAWKLTHQRSLSEEPHVIGDGLVARRALARCIIYNTSAELEVLLSSENN
jgi:Ulp1 family protease